MISPKAGNQFLLIFEVIQNKPQAVRLSPRTTPAFGNCTSRGNYTLAKQIASFLSVPLAYRPLGPRMRRQFNSCLAQNNSTLVRPLHRVRELPIGHLAMIMEGIITSRAASSMTYLDDCDAAEKTGSMHCCIRRRVLSRQKNGAFRSGFIAACDRLWQCCWFCFSCASFQKTLLFDANENFTNLSNYTKFL